MLEETTVELRSRLESVEARAWDLEQRLAAVESTGGSAPSRSNQITPQHTFMGHQGSHADSTGITPLLPPTIVEPVQDVMVDTAQLINRMSRARFDERLFSPVNAAGFPDAIKRGLVSLDQVEMAFQL